MGLDLWAFDSLQTVWLPGHAMGYALVALYVLVLVWAMRPYWAEWRDRLTGASVVALAAVVLLGSLISGLFLVYFPGPEILPLPSLPDVPPVPGAPIFGAVPILLAGGWLGVVPAVIVGLLSGLVRALWITGRGLQTLEVAALAVLAAFMLRQRYRGAHFVWLRHPLVVGIVCGLVGGLLALPSLVGSTSLDGSILPVIDYAWSLSRVAILPSVLEWTVAGVLVWAAFTRLPSLRPQPQQLVPPPYAHSLTRRFLFLLIPLFVLVIGALLVAVTGIAIRSATDLTLKQMSHDARVASETIPDVTLVSANLLSRFAHEASLFSGEQQMTMEYILNLEADLRTTAHFRQLVLFDKIGNVVRAVPSLEEDGALPLVEEEERAAHMAATLGYPSTTQVWVADRGVPMLTHVEPIRDPYGKAIGALMGRVDLGVALQPTVSSLQGTVGAGRGFIVDEQWSVIAHPQMDRLMQPWVPLSDGGGKSLDDRLDEGDAGHAYEGIAPNGTRQLVYYLEGPMHPWTVVVIVPHETVLALATEVAGPLGLFLLLAGAALTTVVVVLTRRLTHPLSTLAEAAGAISEGDLETPVSVSGEDEVGRLGNAFEQMRCALHDRLSELQLLLGVSRSVASNLNLSQGLPPILEGALAATGADGVRIVFAHKERGPLAFAKGRLGAVMAPLDILVARLVQREPMLRIDNAVRARKLLETHRLADRIGAILALPLRTSQRFQGVLWIAYRNPRTFSESEIGFMTTLASQASVFIENVQLFEATEDDRRRLAAILASTGDAVIVTDPHDRILLLNPAAETAFGVSASEALAQPASSVLADSGLVGLLVEAKDNVTREVELPAGRILYANVTSIRSDDKQVMGRVAFLRDITHLKELDEMKTEFVNTVSHDLRSPLTYMRGYVTMLPMVGELSAKQTEYVNKILGGVDQMTELVVDLLNLARIESDLAHLAEPVKMNDLVNSVARIYRTRAMGKGLQFGLELAEHLPVLTGDPTLLRQAITNLVDNGVKYTLKGEVMIRTYFEKSEVIVQVRDTGPGVSQTDQVRLFEKFYRVKRRDALEIKGSGLGLAIVKSVVERRHGGRVWVESQLGVGSSFFIALPIRPSDQGLRMA
jgi:PAS domain S-box-containing protein